MESLNNRKVFIVEDNEFYAILLKTELEKYCNNVTVFSSGEECINNISLRPDVLLLDYNLAGNLNGIDVLKRIKQLSKKLPVLLISGNYSLNVVKEALHIGVEDFIDKSESGLSMIEMRLKNLFRLKKLEMEKRNSRNARNLTLLMIITMITVLLMIIRFSH